MLDWQATIPDSGVIEQVTSGSLYAAACAAVSKYNTPTTALAE